MNKLIKNNFLKPTLTLALPIMLQSLLFNTVTLVDTIMIGQLGSISIAAVGVAAQLFFLITVFLYGVASGGSIFIAQYWGAKDLKGIKKVMGLMLILSLIISGIISIFSSLFPQYIMYLFTKDIAVIESGNTYLRYVGFSYVLTAISFNYSVGFRSTENAKTPLIITIISLSLNVVGNYLLIFGIGRFPELGIKGAAISTAFSRIVEVLLYIIIAQIKKDCPIKIDRRYTFNINREFLKKFFIVAFPVIINDVAWSVGLVVYKIAYSKIGTGALAAVQVIESINNMFFVVLESLGGAVAIVIGKKIGEQKFGESIKYSNYILYFSFVIGIFVGALIAIFAPMFVGFFRIEKNVSLMAINCIYVVAILSPIKSINMSVVIGILRGSGDTKFPMLLELGSIWFIGVPLSFLGVLVFNMTLPQIYLLVGLEELTKFIIGIKRVKGEKYIHFLAER